MTPDTGAEPYCDAPAFLDFYDPRKVADYLRDEGFPASAVDLADPASAPSARLRSFLRAASSDVETACSVGGRYRAADLAALAAGGGNGGALLAALVADLAFGRLVRRRGLPVDQYPQVGEAHDLLDKLRSGEAALPFAEAEAAGLPAVSAYTPPETLALGRPSDQAHRFFGRRGVAPGFGGSGSGRFD